MFSNGEPEDINSNSSSGVVQTYIVHVKRQPAGYELHDAQRIENWHRSFLPSTNLETGEPRLVYSYTEAISGFAAKLTVEEVKAMESMDGFLHAQPDRHHPIHTTYTHQFLDLSVWDGVWSHTLFGEGVIIGVVDTGILPSHPSFSDKLMPPPPTKWKGACHFYQPYRCNYKLIGAVGFDGGRSISPFDDEGHGTHVSGTAAGNFVDNAEVLGMARGTAAGMAPKAHLAIYKACVPVHGCADSNVLAGIDQAIRDGVDILSISIGGGGRPIYEDALAIGAFAAIKKGILTCASAGNSGPARSSLSHDAPWLFTIGASSVDRRVTATVTLGNGVELYGQSAYQPSMYNPSFFPIVYPGINGAVDRFFCLKGSLDYIDVRGKIVLCHTGGKSGNTEKGLVVRDVGGAAMIIMNQQEVGFTTSSEVHGLPVSHVSFIDGTAILNYVYSSTHSIPVAALTFKGTLYGASPSPAVASFSSRGPSLVNGGILKPDVVAPGVNILAAWPFNLGFNPLAKKTFNFLSGTSMAAPHVSGVVALIKSKYPNWPPAAIQSAIMTTAYKLDRNGNPIFDEGSYNSNATVFDRGTGHVNPSLALDPGLLYNIDSNVYTDYLCGLGYRDWQVSVVTQNPTQCRTFLEAEQLNYPSISLTLGSPSTKVITRTVTNVGEVRSVYWARIDQPRGVRMDLSHYKLAFSRVYQEVSFSIQFSIYGPRPLPGYVSEGQLAWVSNTRVVVSPISITFN